MADTPAAPWNDYLPKPAEPDGPWAEFRPPTTPPPTQAAPAAPLPLPGKSSTFRRVVGDSAIDVGKGVIDLGQAAVGAASLLSGGAAGKALESVGYDPQGANQFLGEFYSPERKAANQTVNDAKGFLPTVKAMLQNPSTIAGSVLESAPSTIGGGYGVARSLAPKLLPLVERVAPTLTKELAKQAAATIAGGIGEGAIQAGQSAEQSRTTNADKLLTARQAGAAVASGAVDALISSIGGATAQKLGIADIDTLLAGGKVPTSAKPIGILKRALEGVVQEGVLEELPQSAQEQMWQNYATGQPLMQGVPEAAAQGALTGAVQGGATSAAVGGHGAKQEPAPTPAVEQPAAPTQAEPAADFTVDTQGNATPAQQSAPQEPVQVEPPGILTRVRDKAAEVYPNAQPGSLAAVANAAATPAHVDPATGEYLPPTDDALKAQLHSVIEQQLAGQGRIVRTKAIQALQGIVPRRAQGLFDQVQAERKQGITSANYAENANATPDAAQGGSLARAAQSPLPGLGDAGPVAVGEDQPGPAIPASEGAGGGQAAAPAGDVSGEANPLAHEPAGAQPEGLSYNTSDQLEADDGTTPSGEPYTHQRAAELQAAKVEGGRVFPVDGGYVVRVPQAQASERILPGARQHTAPPESADRGTVPTNHVAEGGQSTAGLPNEAGQEAAPSVPQSKTSATPAVAGEVLAAQEIRPNEAQHHSAEGPTAVAAPAQARMESPTEPGHSPTAAAFRPSPESATAPAGDQVPLHEQAARLKAEIDNPATGPARRKAAKMLLATVERQQAAHPQATAPQAKPGPQPVPAAQAKPSAAKTAPAGPAAGESAPASGGEGATVDRQAAVMAALNDHPEKALGMLSPEEIRAVGAAMGKKFSQKASHTAIAERLTEGPRASTIKAMGPAIQKVLGASAVSPTTATANGHEAAGRAAFLAGKPRELPSYFTKPTGKNAKDFLRGYDAAQADSTPEAEPSAKPATVEAAPPEKSGTLNAAMWDSMSEKQRDFLFYEPSWRTPSGRNVQEKAKHYLSLPWDRLSMDVQSKLIAAYESREMAHGRRPAKAEPSAANPKTEQQAEPTPQATAANKVSDQPTKKKSKAKAAALENVEPAAPFYSALAKSIEEAKGAPKRAPYGQWKGWLDGAVRRGEFKQSERDWLGLDDWIKSQGDVTKQQLADFVRENQVQVKDVTLGGPDAISKALNLWMEDNVSDPPEETADWLDVSERLEKIAQQWQANGDKKQAARHFDMAEEANRHAERADGVAAGAAKFASYQLPGGSNYRELLLTLPDNPKAVGATAQEQLKNAEAQTFRSSHFDQPNILAHVRFNERTDADGKKVLFVEEIQSDWHQQGRKNGYAKGRAESPGWVVSKVADDHWIATDRNGNIEGFSTEGPARRWAEATNATPVAASGVPDAPFKSTDEWAMLAFKRMVHEAAVKGVDSIAWTTGAQQAERYDLSKQVDTIAYAKTRDGKINLQVFKDGNNQLNRNAIPLDEVESLVGKEIAQKIEANEGKLNTNTGYAELSGLDLKVGGEGMRAFYDKILPAAVNKWAKRFGGKVGRTMIVEKQGDDRVTGFYPSREAAERFVHENGISEAVTYKQEPRYDNEWTIRGENGSRLKLAGRMIGSEQHSLTITPAMREAALQGQPLFNTEQAQELSDADLTPEEKAVKDAAANTSEAREKAASLSKAQGEADAHARGFHQAVQKVLGDQANRVEYVRDAKGLPAELRDGVEARNAERDGKVVTAAVYDPASKRVFVLTSVVKTADRAVWNAAHELAGHDGLRKLLGDKLDPALTIALQNPTVKQLADAIMADRNMDKGQRLLAAEESLAELAAAVRTGNYDHIQSRYGVEVGQGIREQQSLKAAIANFLKRLQSLLNDLFGRPVFLDEDVRQLLDAAYLASQQDGNASESTALESTDRPQSFAEQVKERLASGDTRGPMLEMGRTPAVLRMLGFDDLPLHMPGSVLMKLATGKQGSRPVLTEAQIAKLPELIDAPQAVLKSNTDPAALVVVTDAKDGDGSPIVVSVARAKAAAGNPILRVNVLTSGYGKGDAGWFEREALAGRALYADQEKALGRLVSSNAVQNLRAEPGGQGPVATARPNMPESHAGRVAATAKVLSPDDLRNYRAEQRDKALSSKPSILENVEPANLNTMLGNAGNSVRGLRLPAGYLLGDLMGATKGGLNWWHKTVGTQFNLAQRYPAFKAVFDSVQRFIDDTSYYASEAADLAPHLLPKLNGIKDVFKQPVSAADTLAIADPIYQGTLNWTRNEAGEPVEAGVDEAGIVWTDPELRERFGLNDHQIGLYREFRAAIDKSLNDLFVAQMVNYGGEDTASVRQQAIDAGTVSEVNRLLTKHLRDEVRQLGEANAALKAQDEKLGPTARNSDAAKAISAEMERNFARASSLQDTAQWLDDQAERFDSLTKMKGYAPLSRFGRHFLYVRNAAGEQLHFQLFDSARDANKAARAWQGEKDAFVEQGTMSQEAFKRFQGITPETLELFGDMLGLDPNSTDPADQAFQAFLKLSKSNRSAMKRLIHRKGIAGFSTDSGRVLASFIVSNARLAAGVLHNGETARAIENIPKHRGELKDAAIRLASYVRDPQEEAHGLRAFTFAQYLGGSIAAAMVNMTQSITMTFPYLSQYGGAVKAARELTTASRDALKRTTGDAALDAAIAHGEEEGFLAPQEIHQLQAQARGAATLRSGDGTTTGDALAHAHNALAKTGLAWGKVFSVAEAFNRRVAFIAAYRLAQQQGLRDPAGFARNAVDQTQGIYSKGNKPRWARGAVGGTLFTFKQFGVSYVELLHRMATRGGPEGKKAALLALGVMFLMAGASGLPGADDLDDLIDGLLQRLGYNASTKQARIDLFARVFGQGGAQFLEHGVSGIAGVPIDVSGRLGMGNLVPGTGLFQKKDDHSRDLTELVGPVGDLATRTGQAADSLSQGKIGDAARLLSPRAVNNLMQAVDMLSTGMYRDSKGRKVIDTTATDALAKAIGYQPNNVARVQQASSTVQQMIAVNKMVEREIADQWAEGLFEQDQAKVADAREQMLRWNARNPETPIRINAAQLKSRLRSMRQSKSERLQKTAPKEIRANVTRGLLQTTDD